MARAISTTVITFGLVSIPVKLYTAASPNTVSFNMITKDGNRVKQKLVDSVSGSEIERDECSKGYEVAKDKFVVFTKDEIKALEEASDGTMTITEFVESDSIDPVAVEKNYYLGPDKGGDRAYTLLSETMRAERKVAVAKWASRGKDQLVVIRPYKDGLLLQQMYYADEIRSFDEIGPAKLPIADLERELSGKLVTTMATGVFDPAKYEDGYSKRVHDAIERKIAGQAIEAAPNAPKATVVDLLEALKRSIQGAAPPAVETTPKQEPAPEKAKPAKKAKGKSTSKEA